MTEDGGSCFEAGEIAGGSVVPMTENDGSYFEVGKL